MFTIQLIITVGFAHTVNVKSPIIPGLKFATPSWILNKFAQYQVKFLYIELICNHMLCITSLLQVDRLDISTVTKKISTIQRKELVRLAHLVEKKKEFEYLGLKGSDGFYIVLYEDERFFKVLFCVDFTLMVISNLEQPHA